MLFFDIETGPLPDDQLTAICPPFEPPPHPGEFDKASVKVGNLKDQAKIDEKYRLAEEDHKRAVADYDSSVLAAGKLHFESFKSKAALDATTGRVLAIGYRAADNGKSGIDDGGGDESKLIESFWAKQQKCRAANRKLVGANIHVFDLPFLIRRSWILGVDVPASVVVNDRYFDPIFVDLRAKWLLGQRWGDCPSSLDVMAKALGVGAKPNGVGGGDFARLWFGSAEERQQAIAYLLNDLEMTAGVATRLGVV